MATWYWAPLAISVAEAKEYCNEHFGVQFQAFQLPHKPSWGSNGGKWKIQRQSPYKQLGIAFRSEKHRTQFKQDELFIALSKPEKRIYTIDIEAHV